MKACKRIIAALIALAATLGSAQADPVRIVGFGDSLMAGYQLGPGEAFPEKLQTALRARGHDVEVINAGVSGDTSSDGLARLDWSIPDATDLVIVEFGGNDALRGIPPEITEKNIDAMLARLKQREISALLAGMIAPPNMGADYAGEFNPIYPELAEKYRVPFYPFFLDGVAADPKLLISDGMHPNPTGVDRMVEGIIPLIEKAITAK
jgi:acyl-CoA thioesterase I